MELDLSIILPLRDAETAVAAMIRTAVATAQHLELPDRRRGEVAYELLALDEQSHDNTLSMMSILHAQIAQLRTVQGLPPGTAVREGARIASGRVWLIVDRPVELDLALWATRTVLETHRAALVPGEVLAVERGIGQTSLGWLRGGLVAAQREVRAAVELRGDKVAFSPPPDRGLGHRAHLFMRGRLPSLVAGMLDRPRASRAERPST